MSAEFTNTLPQSRSSQGLDFPQGGNNRKHRLNEGNKEKDVNTRGQNCHKTLNAIEQWPKAPETSELSSDPAPGLK